MQKRYQYYAKENGAIVKKWTQWFNWNSSISEPWQLKNKLKNEYRESK